MKKTLSLILALVMCLSLCACAEEKEETKVPSGQEDVTNTLSAEMGQLIFNATGQALYDECGYLVTNLNIERCMQDGNEYTITGKVTHKKKYEMGYTDYPQVDFEVELVYDSVSNTFETKEASPVYKPD